MKLLRNLTLIVGMLSLGSCTVFTSFSEVKALNEVQAVGSPFTQALSSEYRDFSNNELKEMFDYPDALHFARKGLSAASGATVIPENINDWNLDERHERELSAARGRLILAFDMGARETSPDIAAIAQARFDCWIEDQEEKWSDDDEVPCRAKFMSAMNTLESRLPPEPLQANIEPAPAPQPLVFDVDPSEPMAAEDAI